MIDPEAARVALSDVQAGRDAALGPAPSSADLVIQAAGGATVYAAFGLGGFLDDWVGLVYLKTVGYVVLGVILLAALRQFARGRRPPRLDPAIRGRRAGRLPILPPLFALWLFIIGSAVVGGVANPDNAGVVALVAAPVGAALICVNELIRLVGFGGVR